MKKTALFAFVIALHSVAFAQKSPEEKLNMAMYAIMNMYVDSVPKQPFVDAQIATAARMLDPFSEYLDASQANANEKALTSAAPGVDVKQRATIRRSYMIDKRTGYIAIAMFAESTPADFRNTIQSLKKQGMRQLIIDLQGCPGGLFDAAVEMADELLSGDKVIVSTQGRSIPPQQWKTTRKGMFEEGRVAVLVNANTMSAAEIFTAALRDWDRAVIVGQTTYGKGLIQETLLFEDGSALRLTVARYITPCGADIQKPYAGFTHAADTTTKVCRTLAANRPVTSGKGGIAPDAVALADTSFQTPFYWNVTYNGLQKQVAHAYVADKRNDIIKKYRSADAFMQNSSDDATMMTQLKSIADEAGIAYSQKEYELSEPSIRTQLKALAARELYPDDANIYYKILATHDRPTQTALDIISSKQYDNILNGK